MPVPATTKLGVLVFVSGSSQWVKRNEMRECSNGDDQSRHPACVPTGYFLAGTGAGGAEGTSAFARLVDGAGSNVNVSAV